MTGERAAKTPLRRLFEERVPDGSGEPDLWRVPGWAERVSGLVAGITGRGGGYGLGAATAAGVTAGRYAALARKLGFGTVVVGRQVHGRRVEVVDLPDDAGFVIPGERDGLVTARTGVLLTVTAADCVPVYVVAPEAGAVALLHGGWRGTAAGVLETGLAALRDAAGVEAGDLRVHLGPAICGSCYEVGGEVLEALGRPPAPRGHVDLREELAERARRLGVPAGRVTASSLCTCCEPDLFHSYRGRGTATGRMAAFLGRR